MLVAAGQSDCRQTIKVTGARPCGASLPHSQMRLRVPQSLLSRHCQEPQPAPEPRSSKETRRVILKSAFITPSRMQASIDQRFPNSWFYSNTTVMETSSAVSISGPAMPVHIVKFGGCRMPSGEGLGVVADGKRNFRVRSSAAPEIYGGA